MARDVADAFALRDELGHALLAGELRGTMPAGFDMNNSPADLDTRTDIDRPLIILSSSGTQLILQASWASEGAFAACFRNAAATAAHLIDRYPRVAVIGAGSRNEFREEDQMCCAWIASALLKAGYQAENQSTFDVAERWAHAPAIACANGNSVLYLRRSGQMRDYDFVVNHVNDLDFPVAVSGNEVILLRAAVAA